MHTSARRRPRSRLAGFAAILAIGLPVTGALAGPAPSLDPARVSWSEVRMTGSKLFLTADATVGLAGRPVADAGLRDAPELEEITPRGRELLEVVSTARGGGRVSVTTLSMDPLTGAAFQRVQHDTAGRLRHRVYRYGTTGAWHWTRWPSNRGENGLPPAEWTRTSEGLRPYDERVDEPVADPAGILYLVAAAPLDRPGDRLRFTIFSRRRLQAVVATVTEPQPVRVAYDQLWPSGTVRRSATVQAIRVAVTAEDPSPDPDDDELELLGLRGNLLLSLDPESRAPLELSGDVKLLGRVTLRLAAMRPR